MLRASRGNWPRSVSATVTLRCGPAPGTAGRARTEERELGEALQRSTDARPAVGDGELLITGTGCNSTRSRRSANYARGARLQGDRRRSRASEVETCVVDVVVEEVEVVVVVAVDPT